MSIVVSQDSMPGLYTAQALRAAAGYARKAAANPKLRAYAARAGKRFGHQALKRAATLARARATQLATIGNDPGHSTSKKDGMVVPSVQTVDSNSLYTIDATALETDVGSVTAGQPRLDINKRQRATAFISGFRYRQYWQNRTNDPLLIRWFLIASKNQVLSTAGFFRNYETSRDVDFTSTLSTLEKQTYPVSTDKYTIFYEGKEYLAGKDDTSTTFRDRNASNMAFVDRWLPIGRQLQFNDDTNQDCEDKIYICWFATNYLASVTNDVVDAVNTQTQLVAHFRDPLEMLMSAAGTKSLNRGHRGPTRVYAGYHKNNITKAS